MPDDDFESRSGLDARGLAGPRHRWWNLYAKSITYEKQPPGHSVLRRLGWAALMAGVLVVLMMCLVVVMALVARLMRRRPSEGGIGKQTHTHDDRDPENLSHDSILTSPDEVARSL